MTSLLTFMGIFQWNRVSMGIKPAAYYFQRIMALHIFNGLIYEICEVYIDDVLILEKDDEDYLF